MSLASAPSGPNENRADFVNELELETVAASSGRPNKAVEIANWQQLAPLIIQAAQAMAANPALGKTMMAVVRESVERLDDRLEPEDFYPTPGPVAAPPPVAPQGAPGPGKGQDTWQGTSETGATGFKRRNRVDRVCRW